jgi:hypothetical protein
MAVSGYNLGAGFAQRGIAGQIGTDPKGCPACPGMQLSHVSRLVPPLSRCCPAFAAVLSRRCPAAVGTIEG